MKIYGFKKIYFFIKNLFFSAYVTFAITGMYFLQY